MRFSNRFVRSILRRINPARLKIFMTIEWIAQPTPNEQRRFLEEHRELLEPRTEKVLKFLLTVFEDQPEEFQRMTKVSDERLAEAFQRYKRLLVRFSKMTGAEEFLDEGAEICRAFPKALEAIRAGGNTIEAIRTAYVNLFGGLALDVPRWLEESLIHLVEEYGGSPQTARQEADAWEKLIQRAKRDRSVPPEVVAELQFGRAEALLKDEETDIERVITALEKEAREVFHPDRYPLQHARFQVYIAQARGYRHKHLEPEQAIQMSQEILDILSAAGMTQEETVDTQLRFGVTRLLRAETMGSITDCVQAVEYFQAALKAYTRATYPEEWAGTQLLLGTAFLLLGEMSENIEATEQAAACFEAALQVYTREAYPVQWAIIHHYYGVTYVRRIMMGRVEEQEKALDHFTQALEVFTREAFPVEWARAQRQLGDLYAAHPQKSSIEVARPYYEAALEVFTPDKNPLDRARCYYNLGVLYSNHNQERNEATQESAIQCFEAALKIYEQQGERYRHWATIQMNLGMAYRERIKGDKDDNIKQAISCYTKALQVFEQDTSSTDWASLQQALAIAYKDIHLHQRDEATDTEQAIAACEAALQVFTRNGFPKEWAVTQQLLGRLYSHLEKGREADNQERAIGHLHAALQVFTREEYPYEWAATRSCLSLVYPSREQGERNDNIEHAIRHTKAALEVFTRSDFPSEWAAAQTHLADLYNSWLWGDKYENQERALALCQKVVSELSPDTHSEAWMMAQRVLGRVYRERLTGDPAENLARAVACYEEALRFIPVDAFPGQYHITQLVLAGIRGKQKDWQGVHKAYVEARRGEDLLIRLGAGVSGKLLAMGRGIETRDAGARDGFALIRLGKLEEGLVAIEGGQARLMAEALAMDRTDPGQIRNRERRQHFIQARQLFIEAQAELNAPLPSDHSENERRLKDIERRKVFHIAQADLEEVIREIRDAHDPAHFLEDTLSIKTILDAAARGGPGHALVYLIATPWGGMAVAAFSANPARGKQTKIAAFDLPDLRYEIIADLMSVSLKQDEGPILGGFYYAQNHAGFTFFLRNWRGLSFRGYAEDLNDACFREGKVGFFDRAAQDVLASPSITHLVSQPLNSLEWQDFLLLMRVFNDRFLHLELKRVLETLSKVGIPQLVDWLIGQGTTSLTLIPCGPLAALPLAAVPCANGRTVGEILPTSVAPNARSLLRSENSSGEKKRFGIYTLGNPASWKYESLPWSEAEALTIGKLAQTREKLGGKVVGKKATHEWLVNALQWGQVVVASCHGRFEQRDFLRSALLLAKDKDLTLGEVLSHKVDLRGMRLFCLSACQTASADMDGAAANEIKSLAASMLQAGAQAVLASLWPVDDRATFILMVRFIQEWLPRMESEPPTVALARAQRWLRTVTNRELQQWETTALPPIAPEEKREAGVSDEQTPQSEGEGVSLSEKMASGARSYRYDMKGAREQLHAAAKKGDPDERPYADPIYWAGFQITGW